MDHTGDVLPLLLLDGDQSSQEPGPLVVGAVEILEAVDERFRAFANLKIEVVVLERDLLRLASAFRGQIGTA